MTKEVLNHVCEYCESTFKLTYDDEEATSLPKFCPFCSEELFDGEDDASFGDDLNDEDDQSL